MIHYPFIPLLRETDVCQKRWRAPNGLLMAAGPTPIRCLPQTEAVSSVAPNFSDPKSAPHYLVAPAAAAAAEAAAAAG